MPTRLTNPGLRKAAIFVASLDRASADRLLDQMPPEQARQVRALMVELDGVDPEEERQVIEEFRRAGKRPSPRPAAGVELDRGLAQRLSQEAPPAPQPAAPAPADSPFRFLHDAEAEKLAKILAVERPQVIALVLSHLPPEQAGKVLSRLSPAVQADVVHRLVDLEEADPEVLREVERGLQQRLADLVRTQRRRVAGLSAVAGILEASGQRIGMQILGNLSRYDRSLAERLEPARQEVAFDDLQRLDDATLATVLRAADLELVALALVGAPPGCAERMVGLLAGPEASIVRGRLEHLGPIRLSDVEEARLRLVELARRLAMEGKIALPHRGARPTAA